jgi:hypothetical protein
VGTLSRRLSFGSMYVIFIFYLVYVLTLFSGYVSDSDNNIDNDSIAEETSKPSRKRL